MYKLFKNIPLAFLAAMLMASCIGDDSDDVVVNGNPYALNSLSEVTTQLSALASGEIDCLEIIYPITVATYAEGFVVADRFTFNNTNELLTFINNLGEGATYAIIFPFAVSGNGEEISIISNDAFLDTLETEIAECTANSCVTTNTLFAQAYNSISGNEQFIMDTYTHEYTFSISQAGTVCSIGYKGETATLAYLIEIVDDNNTVLYTGNHTFSNTAISYVSIPPVSLEANTNYTIRRSIPNNNNGTGVGTVKQGATDILPVTEGNITIHQARFYGGGGTNAPNYVLLPMIDFVFRPQP
ncbi:hypothetical protein CHU92_12365 [Flavobacterium cyanobacteriorum]|uniref:Uncharacterized protein n=1 Tax=Flavobacterium cyanobacteriorum TaxID=2022802 RepID=A0A255YZE1_9FLAO|nr:hypothetical protein [Flavobacterium cyanobacteriorum]OYQ34025.1 hypothetical protein CHU92_12365 [Flavobacterium cyanobacteriorum]